MTGSSSSSKGAVVVWVVGLLIYLLSVFHRSSLAVAGLAATERFGISAAQLAAFATLQLLVYAGMQIPVGLLLDRFGSRRMMLTGVITLTAAQAVFAVADSYALALAARIFVGMGDAMIFVSVLRLVNSWFAPRRIPLVNQMTGMVGQCGAIIAAAPMTWALRDLGWTKAYLLAASFGLGLAVALLALVHDSPTDRSMSGAPLSLTEVRGSLVASWSHPGTRLGFWTHFTTPFSGTTIGLLWGYPFFVLGEGKTAGQAGLLLTILVVTAIAAGPVLGWAITHHPWHRSSIVLGIVMSIVGAWTVVLCWRGDAPLAVLMVLVAAVGVGGPASMIGFDFGRSFNPAHRLGAATGIINQAGFYSALLTVIAIGVILDWQTPDGGTDYTPAAFRWAMSFQYLLWAVGLVQIWRHRIMVRAKVRAEDPSEYARLRQLG